MIQSLGAADAVIVGSGTGGEIAWAMAGLHPDRVRAVAALAAPHPLDTRGHPRAAVRPSALRRLAFVQLPSFPEQALMEGDLVVAAPARVGRPPGLARPACGDDVPLRGARAVRGAQPDGAAALDGPVDAPPRRPPLPRDPRRRARRPVPVLQVHGGRDGLRPASRAALSKDTAALVASRYQFELLPQAGHYPAEEAPERVTDLLLAWLREVAPVTP